MRNSFFKKDLGLAPLLYGLACEPVNSEKLLAYVQAFPNVQELKSKEESFSLICLISQTLKDRKSLVAHIPADQFISFLNNLLSIVVGYTSDNRDDEQSLVFLCSIQLALSVDAENRKILLETLCTVKNLDCLLNLVKLSKIENQVMEKILKNNPPKVIDSKDQFFEQFINKFLALRPNENFTIPKMIKIIFQNCSESRQNFLIKNLSTELLEEIKHIPTKIFLKV